MLILVALCGLMFSSSAASAAATHAAAAAAMPTKQSAADGSAKDAPLQNWKPLAISGAVTGTTRLYDDFVADTFVFHIKNQDTRAIVVKGAAANGMSQELWYGNESVLNFGHPWVNGTECNPGQNLNRNCGILLRPGQEIAIQVKVPQGTCNRDWMEDPYSPPSINSVKESAYGSLVFYYDYQNGVPAPVADSPNSLRSVAFSANVKCFDYWACRPDEYWSSDCINTYRTSKAHWCVKGGCGYSFTGLAAKNATNVTKTPNATNATKAPSAGTAKTNATKTPATGTAKTVKKACPLLPAEVDCAAAGSSATANAPAWYGSDGCQYKCKKPVPATTTSNTAGKTASAVPGSAKKGTSGSSSGASSEGSKPPPAPSPATDKASASNSIANAIVDRGGDLYAKAMLMVGVYMQALKKP